jgi:hypothetical protein
VPRWQQPRQRDRAMKQPNPNCRDEAWRGGRGGGSYGTRKRTSTPSTEPPSRKHQSPISRPKFQRALPIGLFPRSRIGGEKQLLIAT